MKNVKKHLGLLMVIVILLSSIPTIASNSDDLGFNEYGFKDLKLQEEIKRELDGLSAFNLSNAWESFPMEYNIPLEKEWTVKFSKEFNYSEIAAVSIVSGNEFISVKMSKGANDELVVYPEDNFAGNTNYSLRIVLNNGKRYKKDFTTKNEHRNADIEPNHMYQDANEIYLNEIVKGDFSENDYNDFYKIELPSAGQLNLQAIQKDGGKLSLSLYGPSGDDKSSISYSNSKSTADITRGLQAGTYYIKVNYAYNYGNYTLENNFYPNEYDDDNAVNNYIEASKINLNDSFTGHIGYYSDPNWGNFNDYFKIELSKDGELNLKATHLAGKKLSIYLYGPSGNDKSAISYINSKSTAEMTRGLQAGTYYVRVHSEQYGAYKLENNFYPNEYDDDNAVNNYIEASKINLNDSFTGHIGYYSDPNWGNFNDYFKIELSKDGELNLKATHLAGKKLSIYLYGSNGNDKSAISYSNSKSTAEMTRGLQAGTYYVRVHSEQYGAYKLENTFK